MTDQPSIQCPDQACGAVSYNENDIAYRYCGRCNRYHSDIIYAPAEPVLFSELSEPVQMEFHGCTDMEIARRMVEQPMFLVTMGQLDTQQLVSPKGLTCMSGQITGRLDISIPDATPLTEELYLLCMARRYRQRLGEDCSTVQAMQLAVASLETYYDMESCKFGDEGHRWDRSCAEEVVDEDLEHWDAD